MKCGNLLSLWLFGIIPLASVCQTTYNDGGGVHFVNNLGWQAVLSKAQREKKYIFLDCMASWCGPCKEMDRSVYPDKKLGEFYNSKFLSVKIQMDSTVKDDENVIKKYGDARYIDKKYKITAYPTLLFFTPDGRILRRLVGQTSIEDLLSFGGEIIDSSRNYYVLLDQFHCGNFKENELKSLAYMALSLQDTSIGQEVAKAYILSLPHDSMLKKESIRFIHDFTFSSNDTGFVWFYKKADTIDKIMADDNYAQQIIHSILFGELVRPEIAKADRMHQSEPDWIRLTASIKDGFSEYYANRIITGAKATWAFDHKDMQGYTKYLVLYQDKFGSKSIHDYFGALALNNYAWAIFLYSKNTSELERALDWSKRAVLIAPSPIFMDTYANLLYKLGESGEAILWEDVASRLAPTNPSIQTALSKMKETAKTKSEKN